MTLPPARRWLRRTASLMLLGPLVAALLAGTSAPAAHAAGKATGARTVVVALDTLSPSAPVKGDTLTISGTVTNKSKHTVSKAHVDLRIGSRLSGRAAIDEVSDRSTSGDTVPVSDKYQVALPKLASGVPHPFLLSVPVSKLGLGEDGVYQLGVSLSGQTSSAPYEQVLGVQHTFLPWQTEATDKKTQLTYLWPLISTVHLSAETGSDEQQTPVFDNDALATDLAPGGRLQQMVALGNQLPVSVTWVVDPDLLASVDAMTRDYRVQNGNSSVPGKGQVVANQWLDALEKAVQGHTVIALPFADPDLAALAHRGKDVSGALSHLRPATEVAEKTVETILHVKPSVDFAWPVNGAIDSSIIDVATSAGADKVISRSDSLRDNLPYTPTSARPIGGGTTAVVADARLSTAFDRDMTGANSSTLAVQRFLAQTLALTLQEPGKQRSIVVAPQRMPTASQAQSMSRALHGLDPERWTQPADLVTAAVAKPDSDANSKVPPASRYPKALRAKELPTAAFQEIQSTQDQLDSFEAILSSPDRVEAPFANAIYRTMSTSWRGNLVGAQSYRTAVKKYLKVLTDEVLLIPKSNLTLSGRSATIPVTVQNQLVQGVENLVLRIKSDQPNRLKIDGDRAVAEEPIKIGGGHSQSVKFTGEGNANGPVQVVAQLYTVDGKPYGGAMTFTVKVSEITATVMLVIAGGVLMLVLAGIRMYSQRKRAAARKAAAEPDVQPDGIEDDEGTGQNTSDARHAESAAAAQGAEPGQPSDPAPDTGPENADPSGTGEKVDR